MPIATHWKCANVTLDLTRPQVMGVLNVTPDSFSDGGKHNKPQDAIAVAEKMLEDGVGLVDVGGESTRPGFTPVEPAEELRRLAPVVQWLVSQGALVSIDTRHPSVARECVAMGAQIINDVTGFSDPRMVDVAASSSCGCVVMHSGPVSGKATNASAVHAKSGADDLSKLMSAASAGDRSWEYSSERPLFPNANHVMGLLENYLLDRTRDLEARGVDSQRICLDPGVGFGKSPEDNIVILRNTARLANLGYPLMCAVSRKRFVGTVGGEAIASERDYATAGISLAAVAGGARVLRVHNVRGMVQALDGFWAATSPSSSMVQVTVSCAGGSSLDAAIAAVDAMPLTRVRSREGVTKPSGSAGASVRLTIETALDRVPLRRELQLAMGSTGANFSIQ